MITDAQLTAFCERVTRESRAARAHGRWKSPPESFALTFEHCPRARAPRARLVMEHYGSHSAWGFVDLVTGDLLKAAGWGKPAKHPRGNIETARYGREYSWSGPRYLR